MVFQWCRLADFSLVHDTIQSPSPPPPCEIFLVMSYYSTCFPPLKDTLASIFSQVIVHEKPKEKRSAARKKKNKTRDGDSSLGPESQELTLNGNIIAQVGPNLC